MPNGPSARDEDVELPPLDDDAADPPRPGSEDEDRLADQDDDFELREDLDDGDPLDDGNAHDLDAGIQLDDLDDDLDDDGEGVDVGPIDEGIDFSDEGGDEGDGPGDDEDDDDDLDASPDDGGAEGTADAPEDEVNEAALPELDADEEGADDGALAEVLFAEATASIEGAEAWEPVGGAGADVACEAVAAGNGRVAAGGDALVIGEGLGVARSTAVASGVAAVALADDVLAYANRRGQVLWARGLAAPAVPLGGWSPAVGGVELVATPGRIFILADGALWSFVATGERLAALESSGVRAIAAAGGVVAVLARGQDDGGLCLGLRRGDDETLPRVRLEGEALRVAAADRVHLAIAASGKAIALADGHAVVVSRDGGASFSSIPLGEIAALTFVGSSGDAPLIVAIEPDAYGTAQLVRISASGERATVGEVPRAAPADAADDAPADPAAPAGAPISLAWDAADELLWIASRAGLLAYRRAAKH
jgi:hypothetical protein